MMTPFSWLDDIKEKWNRIAVQYHGLPPNSNDNGVGHTMFVMGALHHEDGSLRGDEFQKQERIPWQNVDYPGRKSNYDGTELVKPPISAEFNDFGKREEDCTIERDQQVNSNVESREYNVNQMVQFECSGKIQEIMSKLGPLRRVGTLEGTTWTKKNPKTSCCLILPHSVVEVSGAEIDTSMCNVQTCDENNETNELCRKSRPIVVDTIIKPNRNSVAISLGHELQDQDQDDDIDYVKEVLVCYIEEVRDYGFEHIIVIGERYVGLLFMDCFGRLFDLDAMNSLLWLRGDYSKIAEREAKGLTNDWGASWIFVESEGIVVEAKSDTPYDYYNFPVENTIKKPKKQSSRKKRHH